MAQAFEWDTGLFTVDTIQFDRALHQLRRNAAGLPKNQNLFGELASRLQNQPGITRREFDRRFRLIISEIVQDDFGTLQAIASHLRAHSPQALNAIRTLLPPELRHVAVQTPDGSQVPVTPVPLAKAPVEVPDANIQATAESSPTSKFSAVALIGTTDEHARNEPLLKSKELVPLRLASLEQLWEVAPTGVCGFVVGVPRGWAYLSPIREGP